MEHCGETFRRTRLWTTDLAEARRIAEDVFDVRLRCGTWSRHGSAITVSQLGVGDFSMATVESSGDFRFEVFGREHVVIGTVVDGALWAENGTEPYGPGDVFIASQPQARYRCRTHDVHIRTVLLPMPLLDRGGRQLRFTSTRLKNIAARAQWIRAVDHVDQLLRNSSAVSRTVVGQAADLLTSTAMAVFAHATVAPTEDHRGRGVPPVLRRAVAFIEANADAEIGLADIAGAVCLSSRAVQYMFQRHLDTTPTKYLRSVRLDRAHRELAEAKPGQTTVAGVAARWGFAHTGRFAQTYRQEFGTLPHTTLRG